MRQATIRATGLVIGLSAPAAAWAQERPWDAWRWHPMWGFWGMWGIGMLLTMLVFWAVIVTGLVLGLRWLMAQGRKSRSDAALDILRERYARGEIGKEEFDAKKRDLGVT